MPGGKTIAHGLFVLSLVPALQRGIFRIEKRGKGLNYGSDRVRYTASVPADSRVRLHQTLNAAERIGKAAPAMTDPLRHRARGERTPGVRRRVHRAVQDE